MYPVLKHLHMTLAALSLGGFLLRGWWMMTGSANLQRVVVRILPHIIDTVFLLSGIGLIVSLRLSLLQHPWLITKLVALLVYIVLGTIALKRGPTMPIRITALLGALLTFAYIVGVAISKSPASWLV